jgi:hypothetical protein
MLSPGEARVVSTAAFGVPPNAPEGQRHRFQRGSGFLPTIAKPRLKPLTFGKQEMR